MRITGLAERERQFVAGKNSDAYDWAGVLNHATEQFSRIGVQNPDGAIFRPGDD